ncbi:MAG: putative nuclease of the RecB family [halophilic archaeon J07HX5]|nr:MAG: putative nuclease of the RecB family [halophilic archaeon J07HX5]
MTDSPRTLLQPTAAAAIGLVDDALSADQLVTLVGRCRVVYEGRATSTLGPGDRLVVRKPDGTMLVHTDEGHQPVNWQPPGSSCDCRLADSGVVLESKHENPSEELIIRFETITHAATFDPNDPNELALSGTESDLRDQILESPSLVEPGFEPRATERKTSAGAIDIYGEDTDGRAVVLELKRRRAGPDAVSQLNRYVDALTRERHADATVRGILVAPSVTDRAHRLLAERGLGFVSLSPTE